MVDVTKVDLEKLEMTKEDFEALEEAEQQRLLEEAPLPAQESENEKQIKGLLYDLKTERDRRAVSEEKSAELEGRIEEMETRLEEATKKREEEGAVDDGEMLTVGEAKKLLKETLGKREEEHDKEIAELKESILATKLKDSEDSAKEKYSPEKVGADLCYDKVIDEGFSKMVKDNPAYKVVVRNSVNPGLEAYKIGLQHPDFAALVRKKTAEGLIDRLGAVKVKTGVGSAAGGTGIDTSKYTLQELIDMDEKELAKLRKKT